MNKITIPVYKPSLLGNEKQYVNNAIDSSWISSRGQYISAFEENFSRYVGCNYCAAVTNGTVALHLALLALGIKAGDEVIVPTLTYIATVNAISYVGAKPIFIDSELDTWQLDATKIENLITPRTKAILLVHLYGAPCDLDKILYVAKKYGLYVVEDCAEALGSKYGDRQVGSFGDISTYSFFGNKTITTGEGGMVATSNLKLHQNIVKLKGQGLAENKEYWHDVIGYNYRMTNIAAAIGLAQLERIDSILMRKKKLAETYFEELKGLPLKFQGLNKNCTNTYWMYSIRTETALIRNHLRDYLTDKGIETRPSFNPIHLMPMYSCESKFVVAEEIGMTGINLPSWPDMSDKEINYVIKSIKSFYL